MTLTKSLPCLPCPFLASEDPVLDKARLSTSRSSFTSSIYQALEDYQEYDPKEDHRQWRVIRNNEQPASIPRKRYRTGRESLVTGIQNATGRATLDTGWQDPFTGCYHHKMSETEGWHSQWRALRELTWLRRAKLGRSRFNKTVAGYWADKAMHPFRWTIPYGICCHSNWAKQSRDTGSVKYPDASLVTSSDDNEIAFEVGFGQSLKCFLALLEGCLGQKEADVVCPFDGILLWCASNSVWIFLIALADMWLAANLSSLLRIYSMPRK